MIRLAYRDMRGSVDYHYPNLFVDGSEQTVLLTAACNTYIPEVIGCPNFQMILGKLKWGGGGGG